MLDAWGRGAFGTRISMVCIQSKSVQLYNLDERYTEDQVAVGNGLDGEY